ncbi:MAG: peptidylprolyl isomerase [Verrucomicrobiota bacterium]
MFRISSARLLFIVSVLLSGLSSSRPAHAQEVLDGMAAVVNEDVITFSQVRDLVGPKERSIRDTYKGNELIEKIKAIRLQAINDLIDRQLILQEFKKNKFQIPEHYVEDRISTITREEFGGDRSAFTRTLLAQGFTLERFKQLETEKMIVQAMRGQVVKGDVIVPATKIAAYYNAHLSEYTTEEQVKLRMITIRKNDNPSGRRRMLEEIRQKIVAGASFADMAKTYSEDSNKEADGGGDWGWIDRNTLNEKLAKTAFALKPGKVSEIIDFESSFYLMFIEARKNSATKPLGELRDEIEKKLIQEERQKRQQEWIAKLRKKAYIKLF